MQRWPRAGEEEGPASHGDESTALVAKDDLPVASTPPAAGGSSSARACVCGCRSQAVSLASLSGSHPSCQARLFFSLISSLAALQCSVSSAWMQHENNVTD